MAFKSDEEFRDFLTMGALGTYRVMKQMEDAGLEPVKLEPTSCTNKVWSSKPKRLRVPDILSLRNDLRVEAKGKSALGMIMSHSQKEPSRHWNAGLRAQDLVAFVYCDASSGQPIVSDHVEYFAAGDMAAIPEADLRPSDRKAASQGAEVSVEWPTWVPAQSGEVLEADADKIVVKYENGKHYTYHLTKKSPTRYNYVGNGFKFKANQNILAGIVPRKASLPTADQHRWDPRPLLSNPSEIERYVGVKALGYHDCDGKDIAALSSIARNAAEDIRVRLEASATLARLGNAIGLEHLVDYIKNGKELMWRMEAILTMTDIRVLDATPFKQEIIAAMLSTARDTSLKDNWGELREAAVWGLGWAGCQAYEHLPEFLDCSDLKVAAHAITAFDDKTPVAVLEMLINELATKAASSEKKHAVAKVLAERAPSPASVERLVALVNDTADKSARNWALITLGQMSPNFLGTLLDEKLLDELAPLHLLHAEQNHLRTDAMQALLVSLRHQNVR